MSITPSYEQWLSAWIDKGTEAGASEESIRETFTKQVYKEEMKMENTNPFSAHIENERALSNPLEVTTPTSKPSDEDEDDQSVLIELSRQFSIYCNSIERWSDLWDALIVEGKTIARRPSTNVLYVEIQQLAHRVLKQLLINQKA